MAKEATNLTDAELYIIYMAEKATNLTHARLQFIWPKRLQIYAFRASLQPSRLQNCCMQGNKSDECRVTLRLAQHAGYVFNVCGLHY